jgi:hypothetical protein
MKPNDKVSCIQSPEYSTTNLRKDGQEIFNLVGVFMDTAIRHGLSLADSSCKQHSIKALE